MNKWIKIILGIVGVIIISFAIDIICIYTINRPLFAIKEDIGDSVNLVYKGLFYNTYYCHEEYITPQIKSKSEKFTCSTEMLNIGNVVNIVDYTKNMEDFACAEALESFYEDDNYTYYWNCIKNQYMVVIYESGYEETISDALKYGTITIDDLDTYNINYIKYSK